MDDKKVKWKVFIDVKFCKLNFVIVNNVWFFFIVVFFGNISEMLNLFVLFFYW